MTYVVVLLVVLFSTPAYSQSESEHDKKWREAIEAYSTWGVLTYAMRKTEFGNDPVVTRLALNVQATDVENARNSALKECEAKAMGQSCIAISFPGCFYLVVGRVRDEALKRWRLVYGVRAGLDANKSLSDECTQKGFHCSPPIGGCNYVNRAYQSRLATDEAPIDATAEIFFASKDLSK